MEGMKEEKMMLMMHHDVKEMQAFVHKKMREEPVKQGEEQQESPK